ncbi:hypothetical protein CC2G_006348 [Coprinopsis cinerea AmutBmut pab1-1]|nr:hypothetical protein CC2G_006348 [Coprinopsis cinerea AmutBmut pab1-1]
MDAEHVCGWYSCTAVHSPRATEPLENNVAHIRLEQREIVDPDEGEDSVINVELTWSVFLHFLQIPTLETLSVYGQMLRAPEWVGHDSDKIVCPNLQHLQYGLAPDPVEHFLPHLVASKLETITLRHLTLFGDGLPVSSVEKTFPSLRILTLACVYGTVEGFRDLVVLTNEVKHLSVALSLSHRVPGLL